MHIYISSTVYIRQQNGYKLYWKHHFWRHETKVFPNFFMGFSSTYIYIYTFLTCGLKLPLCQLWWFANVPLSAAVANFPNKYHWHDELQLRREDVLWATAVCNMMIHSYIHARVEAWVRVASESGNNLPIFESIYAVGNSIYISPTCSSRCDACCMLLSSSLLKVNIAILSSIQNATILFCNTLEVIQGPCLVWYPQANGW